MGLYMTIILKCILKEQDMSVWTAYNWLRIRSSSESFEHCNEPSSYVERGKSLDQLSEGGFPSIDL
jgi:hypothetical protein